MLCLSSGAADAAPNVTLDMARLVNSCTALLPRSVNGTVGSEISCGALWCLSLYVNLEPDASALQSKASGRVQPSSSSKMFDKR